MYYKSEKEISTVKKVLFNYEWIEDIDMFKCSGLNINCMLLLYGAIFVATVASIIML